ncbi:MAG: dephospho-CoA kinase [Cystobacterineae bacterium]|nr:dephospho-CoA kinase [Cystobacterineae bacterium]
MLNSPQQSAPCPHEHAMRTLVIGLTGGIATGKTTAARYLRHFGFGIMDADGLARTVFEEHFSEIRRLFPKIAAHSMDAFRQHLGEEIFAKPEARHTLNAFMLPAIRRLMQKQQQQFEAENVAIAFYDAPLLFETGGDALLKATLLIYAPYPMQLQRLMERNAYSKKHALERIGAQMDIESKKQRATWVVENLTSPEELHRKLDQWREKELSAFLLKEKNKQPKAG